VRNRHGPKSAELAEKFIPERELFFQLPDGRGAMYFGQILQAVLHIFLHARWNLELYGAKMMKGS